MFQTVPNCLLMGILIASANDFSMGNFAVLYDYTNDKVNLQGKMSKKYVLYVYGQ